jgi:hypothetical protein
MTISNRVLSRSALCNRPAIALYVCRMIIVLGLCLSSASSFAQMTTIATDTLKVSGARGTASIVVGDSTRVIKLPERSGTIALEVQADNEPIGKRYKTYLFTGQQQQFVVPTGVYQLRLDLWGAQGGQVAAYGGQGGLGGFVSVVLECNPGDVLYIYVGGNNGWNGGGNGALANGGGATDIRKNGVNLNNRIVVAGGGGASNATGGAGGGGSMIALHCRGGAGGERAGIRAPDDGGPGASLGCNCWIGGQNWIGCGGGGGGGIAGGGGGMCVTCAFYDCNAAIATNGNLGTGGNGEWFGGGGGYYGGGGVSGNAGYGVAGSAGGGSSWCDPNVCTPPVQFLGGIKTGDGKVRITW